MKANTTHQAHLPSTGHRRLATKALMGIRTPDLLVREVSAFHPTVSPVVSMSIDLERSDAVNIDILRIVFYEKFLDSQYQIPAIEFAMNSPELDRGTDEWYHLCKKVREACENYGCFEIVYDRIPPQLKAETFCVSRELFSLPLEKKKKNINPKPYQGYNGPSVRYPLYEGFGFEEASNYESLRSLTEELLPHGHDQFCTVISMTKKLDELKNMINLMILDGYGLEETSNSFMVSKTLLKLMKYTAPPSRYYSIGTPVHTDKAFSTILCDDQVSGLEVQTRDEQWVKLSISPRSFVFLVGDYLMVQN
ncbi:hypothetical protein ACLB2K_022674 [Fragaria x ananassa]